MGEYNDKRDEFWGLFDQMEAVAQLSYLRIVFGDSIDDQVRNWDDETLTDAIEELRTGLT